jgi:ribonucleoside-triphosphate reductase
MIDHGVPCEPDVTRPERTSVFSFPMRSPAGALCREDLSALQQLELWLSYQRHWCEHKPSVTISVRESEWMEVGAWVWKHFDEASGISFLPMSEHTYVQAPSQDCDAATYEQVAASMPRAFSWQGLQDYELEDNTQPGKEFSCTSGSCEAVDIVSHSSFSQPSVAQVEETNSKFSVGYESGALSGSMLCAKSE